MYKVLILGGSGLVGKAIIHEMMAEREFEIYATYSKNPIALEKDRCFKLDIEEQANISNILDAVKPHIVISCLRGEFDKQLSLHRKVAEYQKKQEGKLYFCSTTNVFDNDLSKPHYEEDFPNSHTEYGKYKIECEKAIIEILQDNACILRLPQVWGKDSPRMKQLLNSMKKDEKVVVYSELFCSVNTDVMIAKQLCYIIKQDLKGIFHMGAEGLIKQKDFYNRLITGLGLDNVVIEEELDEKGYFVLLSKRSYEFPESLRITNEATIEYLTGDPIGEESV